MRRLLKGRLGALAGLLTATMIGLLVAMVAAPAAAIPTLRFYCMDFNLMSDGTIQALVQVEVENIPYFLGTDFYLEYNPQYLSPSSVNSNDDSDPTMISRNFFRRDDELYVKAEGAPEDPFSDRPGSVNRAQSTLVLNLLLNRVELVKAGEEKTLGKIKTSETDADDKVVAYIDTTATGEGNVVLGELSFRVPADKITEMVETYAGGTAAGTPLLKARKPAGEAGVSNAWELVYYKFVNKIYEQWTHASPDGENISEAKVEYIFEFPNTLVKAALPVDYVRLNAWEAYADGGWTDVAAALQRYAGQITAGYANGNLENQVFPWGKANTADPTDPTQPQSDYTIYSLNANVLWTDEASLKALGDGSWAQVTTGTDTYDATHGVYKVQQNFLYEEDGTDKKYPIPRTAYLVIDPVTLTGAWAKDMDKTYRASDVPADFDGLRLPTEAILQTVPALGKVSLTAPIAGWTPPTLPDDIKNGVEGTYEFTPAYAQADLDTAAKARYPWLTRGSTNFGPATRTVVADTAAPDPKAAEYTLVATHAAGTKGHGMTLEVKKINPTNGDLLDISDNSDLVFYLPNGTKIEGKWWPGGGYTLTHKTDAVEFYYLLEMDADLANAATQDQKEQLIRYVNLGGWLSVTVDEPAVSSDPDPVVSDKVYGYLAPRPNEHTKSYIGAADQTTGAAGAFDFTGYYAGLLPLYATSVDATENAEVNPFGPTVVLPLGYTVATTYDGATGEEPGRLGVVKVPAWQTSAEVDGVSVTNPAQAPWTVAPGKTIQVSHGPNDFSDGAIYDGFGRVDNPDLDLKAVEIQAEFRNPSTGTGTPPVKPAESLAVYEKGAAIAGVVYDTRQKGYVAREERTLTLRNTGTTDISGIWLDMDHAPFGGEARGHFEILRAPAAYLPAGGETTFVVTYVYNLDYYVGSEDKVSGTTYLDKISVNTNQTQAVTTFTAQFRVTQGPVSTVEVVTIPTPDPAKPGGNLMGTAMLIQGLGEGLPNPGTDLAAKPDSAPGNTSYEEGYQYVWVQANPDSEYTVKEVYYYTGNNATTGTKTPLVLYEYDKDGTKGDGEGEYHYFQMPGHTTTVYVEFEESIASKLRLSALLVYGGVEADVTTGTVNLPGSSMIAADPDTRLQPLRRDDRDTNALLTYPANTTGVSSADAKHTLTEEESSYPEFFSVLPAGADYVQLSLTLRQTLEMLGLDGTTVINQPLNPVKVEITTPSISGSGGEDILNSSKAADPLGSTGNPPTQHTTYVFDAPAKGEEKLVTITLGYEDTRVSPTEHHERSFRVRLVRLTGEGIQPNLGYGNSPFGMIMNDTAIQDKVQAKADFQAGHTFRGVTEVPAKAAGLTNTYWPEAPGYKDGQPVSAWGEGENYDLDETALFVFADQPFLDPGIRGDLKDAAGNKVDLSKVILSVEDVDLLTTAAADQIRRFTTTQTATINIPEKLGVASNSATPVAAGWADGHAVRPGVYRLTYTFTDYDGTPATFHRPLIILTPVGDVNADGKVTTRTDAAVTEALRDEVLLENRVTDPLGYTVDTWKWAELFRLRGCDGNNDRILNHIDANAVKANALIPYYLPVDYK